MYFLQIHTIYLVKTNNTYNTNNLTINMSTTTYNNSTTIFNSLFNKLENHITKRKLGLWLTIHAEKVKRQVNGLNLPEEKKYLKQIDGTWLEAVEQLDGTFIEFYKTKPPEPVFEMNERSMCWAQTNKEAKSTYDQLTIDLLCKSELVDQKGYNVSFTKDGNVSLYKLSPDCVTHEHILAQYMLWNFEHKYNDKRIQKLCGEYRIINEVQIFAGKHAYNHSENRISFRPIQVYVLQHLVANKISLIIKGSYNYLTDSYTTFAN